ncbi:MAG TPA: sugar phosphate isomerase/epimerase [Spirochaetia bacterium]|nr:sugar phosphate isomerase/epimerase [Spirochaetia bacterium]
MSSFPFKLALNTSTLRPYGLSIPEQIDVAAGAGFDGVELWVRDIQAFVEESHRPAEIARQARDRGIAIINSIAFFKWTDADADVRQEGLEQARREIDLLKRIGCLAVAAPPTGNVAELDLEEIAENFLLLDKLARSLGVTPILEFWGRAPVLHSVAEAKTVLRKSGRGQASMLLDLFHMYTGGSTVDDVAGLRSEQVGLVHINDYPSDPPRETISDSERVMPGDGTGPVLDLYRALAKIGYGGYLSVELFRSEYEAGSAAGVAKEAREKTVRVWEAASG